MGTLGFTKRKVYFALSIYAAAAILVLFCLLPVAWMLSTSFKTYSETFATPPHWIPRVFTFEPYMNMWRIQPFVRYFMNSVIVATATTLLAVLFAALAGYGFSRCTFKGANMLLVFTLVTQMFPSIVLIVPYFIVMSRFGLINSYPSLIIAYMSFSLPFCIWMLKGFFDTIPRELDEAAMIDGCSRLKAFLWVIVPLSLPGIFATILFSFLVAWTEFLFALCLTMTPDMATVTVGITSLVGQYRVYWNELMAASVVASIPTICLCIFLEKYLIRGLTLGAVKG